jgi:hypothetical protein
MSPTDWRSTWGAQRQQPVFTGIVVNNFILFHCRLGNRLLACRRALYTRSTLFYVEVVRTSVAPSALHTLFACVTSWEAHNMLEMEGDGYT